MAATSRDLDLDCLVQALERSIRIPCFNPGSFIIEDVPIAQWPFEFPSCLRPPTRILSMFSINPDKEVKPSLTLILASLVDVQSGYYVPDAGG